MIQPDIAEEIVVDLLRSAWVIEASRGSLYELWARTEDRFATAQAHVLQRARIIEKTLSTHSRANDSSLVEGHCRWMRLLAGDRPDEVPLGEVFMSRLGDWIGGHLTPFLPEVDIPEFEALAEKEKQAVMWPETMPAPPPYEPVPVINVEPPGEVLFRFGVLGDLHIGSPRGEVLARAAIAELNRSGAQLVVQLGDITDHGEKTEFVLARKILADLEMPLATMMGNHDVYAIGEGRLGGREYYSASFGREPDGVILEHKGFRFTVLDSVEHGASPFSPFDMVTGSFVDGRGGAIVRGSLTSPQHDLLAEVAAPDSPPGFIFLHHPPQPFLGFPPILFGLRDVDSGRLHAAVDSGNVWGVFAGHTHRNALTRRYGNVPAQEVAIPRDYPFGYALVDVTSSGYAYHFVQLSDEELLREAYRSASLIHRRYALGTAPERGFIWESGPAASDRRTG